MKELAQLHFAPDGGFKGFGPLGTPGDNNGLDTFSRFISSAIGLMTIIAIIWFVFTFITGAIGILASGGDKNSLESAKKKITTGLIGLTVTILGIFIIRLFGAIIGFGNILDIRTLFGMIQVQP